MTTAVPSQLLEQLGGLTAGAVKTYLGILWLQSQKVDRITQVVIAQQINATPRSVVRYIQELERVGYLRKRIIRSGLPAKYELLLAA